MMHVEQNFSYILFLQSEFWDIILVYTLHIQTTKVQTFMYTDNRHFWFSLITQINFNMYKNFDFDQICFLIRINTAPNHIYLNYIIYILNNCFFIVIVFVLLWGWECCRSYSDSSWGSGGCYTQSHNHPTVPGHLSQHQSLWSWPFMS